MQSQTTFNKLATALLVSSLTFLSGCGDLNSLLAKAGLFAAKDSGRLSKSEIKREIAKCKEDLPYQIDENFELKDITLDFSGNIVGWYRVSDDMADKLRRIGSVRLKEHTDKAMEDLDLDNSGAPPQIKRLLMQDDVAIQYIMEDRYGSPLASFMVSKQTLKGEERVGKTQQNPFAVREVSGKGD